MATEQTLMRNAYTIYVAEYANVPNYPLSGLIYGAHNQGTVRLPYCYVVIKGQGHIALVDVGYNHKEYGAVLAQLYGVRDWKSPRVVLAECGIAPEDVTDAFLTHAHFDHMGNIEDFPNAKFYIQERELSKWIWAMSLERRFRWIMGGVDPADIMRTVDLARNGRLVCVDGDRENVLPGIDLRGAPDTHTWGSMYVHLRNDLAANSKNSWVFAGDLIYKQENLRGNTPEDPEYLPIGFAMGSQFNLVMITEQIMKAVDGDAGRVIAVHEERLKDMYPSRLHPSGVRITELAVADLN
jgi:glyoxylase-like metal-dependent hydrolase (beta-lactamase superfamily II)